MTDGILRIGVNGSDLGYSLYGVPEGRPPIVFAHGYAMRSTSRLYEKLLHLLAARHAVYALDLRGHGASADAVHDWTFEQLADDVVDVSRALGLERPAFVGHSFGAVIGLLAEIRHPGTFCKICLLSPGPADHRKDPVETLDFMIEHGHDRDALRGAFGPMFVTPPGEMLELTVDAATMVDGRVHRAQKEQNPRFSIDDRLQGVAAPTLLVRGDEDKVVPPAKQHDMASKLSLSTEVVFPAEGHMMAIERPDLAAREVLAFLSEDARPTRRTETFAP